MNNPLSIALANILGSGAMSEQPYPSAPQPTPHHQGISKGQLIAGILADALKGAAGQAPIFAPMMERRQADERDEINWGRRRQAELEDYERKQQIEQRYAGPSPMVRDAQAWQQMTPEQRTAFQEMNQMKAGDPDVFVTLPNGQVYAGPKSGLSQALMGRVQTPTAPVGRLTPINGGPPPQGAGGFPRY